MWKKSADVELKQLKSALRFLADEWEHLAEEGLLQSKQSPAASQAGLILGRSKTHYQAAGAVQLLLNMVSTLEEDDEIGPLTVAREIINATGQ